MGGAPAPGALSAALFWQPHTKAPAASASSKTAFCLLGVSVLVLRSSDASGHMPVYLASNLTTLHCRNKIQRVHRYWTQGKAVGYIEVCCSRLVPFQLGRAFPFETSLSMIALDH